METAIFFESKYAGAGPVEWRTVLCFFWAGDRGGQVADTFRLANTISLYLLLATASEADRTANINVSKGKWSTTQGDNGDDNSLKSP
jgi:hypothetical protein